MALLAYWSGLLWRWEVHMCMRWSRDQSVLLDQQLCTSPLSSALIYSPLFHSLWPGPGSTSLPFFVSDAAVFPCPLLRKDCGFDPFFPFAGGSHLAMAEWAMAECWLHPGMPAGPCYCRCPETVARCQPAPQKRSWDSVASAFQGLWKIATHIWHQASHSKTLPQHRRM